MFNRILKHSNHSSFFIFGARGTGKTTWLKSDFLQNKSVWHIDFLDPDIEAKYFKNPNLIRDELKARTPKPEWIILDEVQKIPKILDVVHGCIEELGQKFVLTGSSARKLKRGHANLLAGRAFVHHMFPLTHQELGQKFDLQNILQWGSLPQVFHFEDPLDKARYLKSYSQTYLREEIQIEQLVRKVEPFRHFLEIAAQLSGEIINYSNIARDVGVDTVTVQTYFQILEDTWIGHILPSYNKSVRKQQRQAPKFYFFDLGIIRALQNQISQELTPSTYGFGKAFEHFVILEALRLNHYFELDFKLSYLRTKDDAEVDLVIERPGRPTAFVEIKSTQNADERSIYGIKNFKDIKKAEFFLLSQDTVAKQIDGIQILHWEDGLRKLGFANSST